jgi:LysM repeat protein
LSKPGQPSICPRVSISARGLLAAGSAVWLFGLATPVALAAGNYPITSQQRATAQQVAEAGVPLSELAPNAPDSHTVVKGDTLWGISGLFLKSPWRWPELWGMNMDQIRNPHLIYPGQVLVLEKVNGRARLRVAGDEAPVNGTVKLSPHVRTRPLADEAISAVPLSLIAPFLNEAVVFNTNELESAPRIVAGTENRVVLGSGDTIYVRGDLDGGHDFRVFRTPKPLLDPATHEVLGYEAAYLGAAELTQEGGTAEDNGKTLPMPASLVVRNAREEIGIGDRLAPLPTRDYTTYAPHQPAQPISGQIVSIYGGELSAGKDRIVALNRGKNDGMERGDVLALWRDGEVVRDHTANDEQVKLPNERQGLLFVFSVFDRVSYALILSAERPVKAGDRFTQP